MEEIWVRFETESKRPRRNSRAIERVQFGGDWENKIVGGIIY